VYLHIHFPLRLHGVMLNQLSKGTISPLRLFSILKSNVYISLSLFDLILLANFQVYTSIVVRMVGEWKVICCRPSKHLTDLSIYGSINHAVGISDCIASNDGLIQETVFWNDCGRRRT
jgi:hypothetical protein